MSPLSHAASSALYDRIGRWQDTQRFYENAAIEALLAGLDLGRARAVVEFGCGTGRLAERLLDGWLPADATYLALDSSATMAGLAAERLARFGGRAAVHRTDGAPRIEAPDGAFDRFLSLYVLDVLAPEDVRAVVGEARRTLEDGGRAGFVSLTRPTEPASRAVIAAWTFLHGLHPALTGGCRPIVLADWVRPPEWEVLHDESVTRWGVPSEVLVACAGA